MLRLAGLSVSSLSSFDFTSYKSPQDGLVQVLGPVRCRDHDDAVLVRGLHSVEADEELRLKASACLVLLVRPSAQNGVYFVNEDHRGLEIACDAKEGLDQLFALAEVFLHQGGCADVEKYTFYLVRYHLGQQGLPIAWRAVKEDS